MGRCIYGGIYDPKNPLSDSNGFRKDVQQCIRDLQVPVVRWPGGNFTATYHWMDGIGPVKDRPKKVEPAWLSTESNELTSLSLHSIAGIVLAFHFDLTGATAVLIRRIDRI